MASDNENTNKEQPPKINLNRTENGVPSKVPPPVRVSVPSKMKADTDAPKKETTHIELSSAMLIPKGVTSHNEDDLKKRTTRIDRNSEIVPVLDEEKKEAAKKSTIRINTSEIMPLLENDKNEAAKKSTVRVQIDEDRAKGDTTRLDAKSIAADEEAAKKRTARIDLNELLDESDDIFKRRTVRMDTGKTMGVTEAPGVPQTVRMKRSENPPSIAPRKPSQVAKEETPTASSASIKSETSRKSETARIDLPPEITEQPPTRRKTIRIKRPEGIVTSRPLVIGSAKSMAGSTGPAVIPKEEETGVFFSAMAIVAILIGIALITVQSLTLYSFLQF